MYPPIDTAAVERAARILSEGGLVAIPTGLPLTPITVTQCLKPLPSKAAPPTIRSLCI